VQRAGHDGSAQGIRCGEEEARHVACMVWQRHSVRRKSYGEREGELGGGGEREKEKQLAEGIPRPVADLGFYVRVCQANNFIYNLKNG
jgi:hypothetical protein